ncbi:hypothetical protein O181_064243 [Austropuccinia psidii MF-1]|uniref:Uncharacterized protein n=1 Tax=Austropuccinia psidii MF-1 TaxID=1389203 RepID=A0A9Q3I1E9_9BASI|nr:hypothetical protein [Austropuccinia psidii MF-1]
MHFSTKSIKSLQTCEKISGPSQHLKVTEWMASIDGKEEYDAFNSRTEEKQSSTTQTGSKTSPKQPKTQKNHAARATESQRFNNMPWKMCFSFPEP